jgi:hypothetical protein
LVGEHFEITAHSWLSLLFFVDWWMMADNCDESFSDDYNKLQKALAWLHAVQQHADLNTYISEREK